MALRRILLVEDEPDIRQIVQLSLETMGGFAVKACGSGEQALQCGAGFHPDLILLDFMLPGMDGPATLQALRLQESLAHTPAVFMTARAGARDRDSYRAMGAVDVIQKPFDPLALADTVQDIWRHHCAD